MDVPLSNYSKLKQLVLAAIFCALIILMSFTPIGYLRIGILAITLIPIPVIIGAIVLGPMWGAILGFVFGATSLIQCFMGDPLGAVLLSINLPFTVLTCILPRIAVGLVPAYLFRALNRRQTRNRTFAVTLSALVGSFTNTVLFLGTLALFFANSYLRELRGETSLFLFLIGAAGINCIVEAVTAALITPAVYFAVRPHEKVLGIDIGASTTKIVLAQNGRCLKSMLKSPDDTLEEAIEKFGIAGAKRVALTGVGSTYLKDQIAGLPTQRVDEFAALYRGAAKCSKNHNCIVVSIGTGTSFVRVTPFGAWHLGGSGVGGGMLQGLSQRLLRQSDIGGMMRLAQQGDLHRVNLQLGDVSKVTISNLSMDSTVANMAKVEPETTSADIAAGICNMVFESVGVMAAFAVKHHWTRSIVVVGTVAGEPIVRNSLDPVGALHKVRYLVPANAPFATAIGATMV